ncbi:MAG: hypothetical protein HY649_00800 [Acidobacteria bacterium]|nr:hypothetical protein [Acidobacteriota bacterium]
MINSSGYVGIGTTSPGTKLDVRGDALRVGPPGTGTPSEGGEMQLVRKDGSTVGWSLDDDASDDFRIFEYPNSSIRFRIKKGATGDMVLAESGGNVGIGKTDPAEKLDVAGNILCQGLNKIVFLKPLGGGQDDQPQISAAISALPTEGGIIYLTPGTYRIGSKVSVSKNGVKLRGYGGAWRDGALIRAGLKNTSA